MPAAPSPTSEMAVTCPRATGSEIRAPHSSPARPQQLSRRPAIDARAGFNARELKNGGFTAEELATGGFGARELRQGGFNAAELRAADFPTNQIKSAGYPPRALKEAGFSAAELKEVGFSANDLFERKNPHHNAGYSADELHSVGFSAKQYISAGVRTRVSCCRHCSSENRVRMGFL